LTDDRGNIAGCHWIGGRNMTPHQKHDERDSDQTSDDNECDPHKWPNDCGSTNPRL